MDELNDTDFTGGEPSQADIDAIVANALAAAGDAAAAEPAPALDAPSTIADAALAELGGSTDLNGAGGDLGLVLDVPVEVAVEIGRARMTVREALAIAPGTVVSLDRLAGEPVDLLINGRVVARGEVVAVDEEFGLLVTEVLAA